MNPTRTAGWRGRKLALCALLGGACAACGADPDGGPRSLILSTNSGGGGQIGTAGDGGTTATTAGDGDARDGADAASGSHGWDATASSGGSSGSAADARGGSPDGAAPDAGSSGASGDANGSGDDGAAAANEDAAVAAGDTGGAASDGMSADGTVTDGGAVADGGAVGNDGGAAGSDGGAAGTDGGAQDGGAKDATAGDASADAGGSNPAGGDGTESKPALSCKALHAVAPQKPSGLYWVLAGGGAVQTWCDMARDGGGWTLVAVVSADKQDTWTWANQKYFTTDAKVFGSPTKLTHDFKSPLYQKVAMADVLFVHHPSGVWGAYHGFGDGQHTIAAKMASLGEPKCLKPGSGWPMSAGTIGGGDLCDNMLYWSPLDHDGNESCGDNEHAFGPAWNAGKGDGCPFNDPGKWGGLGPISKDVNDERDSVGFGGPMGVNKASSSDPDRMWILVR